MPNELTTANKILVAAADLDEERETFTAEDLIVRAWTQFPESFGLTGYRDRYPDSNRVLAKLMGSVGLCSRGWLEQISTKLYRVTPSGRKFAASLREGKPSNDAPEPAPRVHHVPPPPSIAPTSKPAKSAAAVAEVKSERPSAPVPKSRAAERLVAVPPPPPTPIHAASKARAAAVAAVTAAVAAKAAAAAAAANLAAAPPPPPPPPVAEPPTRAAVPFEFDGAILLSRLLSSGASQKFMRGGLVTFADACVFWSISPTSRPAQLAARLSEIDDVLKQAEAAIQQSGAAIRVNDRLEVNLTQVIGLQGLHKMLRQKYNRELEAIRVRNSEE